MTSRSYLCFLLVLMGTPGWVFLLHILDIRIFRLIRPAANPLAVAALALVGGYPVTGSLLWICHLRTLNPEQMICPIIYATIVYSCLSFCYFIIFTMTETARRIHILQKLYDKKVPITWAEMASKYDAGEMLSVRLERMAALCQLKRSGDRYFSNNRLLYWAGMAVAAWAKLLGFSEKDRP